MRGGLFGCAADAADMRRAVSLLIINRGAVTMVVAHKGIAVYRAACKLI